MLLCSSFVHSSSSSRMKNDTQWLQSCWFIKLSLKRCFRRLVTLSHVSDCTALLKAYYRSVMWFETVGLYRIRPVWDQKKSVLVLVLHAVILVLHTAVLILVLQVWYCVVKHGLVTLVVIMILNDTATFKVLFIVSLFWSWNITTVEINSGVHLLKS